ncbi:MAG: hypothetical protein IPP73_10380 [Chitinophagaceae bacterium]|nr:hypothetical protein [Chitinophagaceae bacterium]
MSNRLLVVYCKKNESGLVAKPDPEVLQQILQTVFTPEQFCIPHELVNRNRITRRAKRILKEAAFSGMRPFRFLINKN